MEKRRQEAERDLRCVSGLLLTGEIPKKASAVFQEGNELVGAYIGLVFFCHLHFLKYGAHMHFDVIPYVDGRLVAFTFFVGF